MFNEMRRLILQIGILLSVAVLLFATGGDSCSSCHGEKTVAYYGSDSLLVTQYGETRVERYHDFKATDPTATAKELAFLRDWLPGNAVIGLQVPQAPGASQPGSVTTDTHKLWIQLDTISGTINIAVDLVGDDSRAADLAAVFPPDPNTQWQALVPASDDYITRIPTQTTTFTLTGSLMYTLDFHGNDACNGCEVKIAPCTADEVPLTAKLAASSLLRGVGIQSAGDLTCIGPIPTFVDIHFTSPPTIPVPALPPVAAFGLWGGTSSIQTLGPQVEIPYSLGHTGSQAETFKLESIQSDRGWSYGWYGMTGTTPITQVVVVSQTLPWPNNVRVIGTVPTCTLAVDTIHLTATSVTTPSWQAKTNTLVSVQPDPATCSLTDLAIAKTRVSSTGVISAGQWVTYTLTITNYAQSRVSAVVTDTLSPAWAVSDVSLPAGCARNGGEITCQVTDVPTDTATTLTIAVQVAGVFSGTLNNTARVEPAEAVDGAFYDNADRATVTVIGEGATTVYLPTILKSYSP